MKNGSPEKLLEGLVGKSPWQVSLGAGSVVSMEFGAHDPRQSGARIHGEWSLWLYVCSWRLETPNAVVVGCEDDRDRIRKCFRERRWGPISEIKVLRPALDLEITFEDQSTLRTFSVNATGPDEQQEQWIVYTPHLRSIIAKGGLLAFEEYPVAVEQSSTADGPP